jgi:hypothetical protein
MTRQTQGYLALVRTFGRTVGKRELVESGTDCSGLGEAVAVSLALLWSSQEGALDAPLPSEDEEPTTERIEAKTEPTETGEPEVSAVGAPKKRVARRKPKIPTKPEAASTPLRAELLGGVAVSVLDGPTPALEIGFAMGVAERVSLGISGDLLAPDRLALAGGTVRLELFYGSLKACVEMSASGPSIELCARPMLGALRGSGEGFQRSRSQTLLYAAMALGLEARGLVTESLGWVAHLTALTPLQRHQFSVLDVGTSESVFITPSLGGFGLVGLSWGGHR